MSTRAFLANSAWAALSLPAHARFCRALEDPAAAQRSILSRLVARNAASAFGRTHGFAAIHDYADFAARVPLASYEDFDPWIARIMRGEARVLTTEPVTRLVPTSGSTGGRKLIPFTAGLQREFNAAIGAWMIDLFRLDPTLLRGCAYWSITPLAPEVGGMESSVKIGFDEDTSYLGGIRKRLIGAAMAVPASVGRNSDVAEFRRATLVALLRRADLRLISVWHPSFLSLLLDELIASWDELVREARARRLHHADPRDARTIWPRLRLVSCWADGHAGLAAEALERRLPGVRVQPKGLLATEGFVTLPFRNAHPLAITSHFFEFLTDDGHVVLADALQKGEVYEVVVTTAGGLWRYRLGDRVVVSGWLERTPSLRFVGRVGGVCDRRGEKLSEAFVATVLRELFAGGPPPRFVLLAPEDDEAACGYVLFVEGATADVTHLDIALRLNPHYAWSRDLGQLRAPRLFRIACGGYEAFARRAVERGRRLGDIKPTALSPESGWSARFCGAFVDPSVKYDESEYTGSRRHERAFEGS